MHCERCARPCLAQVGLPAGAYPMAQLSRTLRAAHTQRPLAHRFATLHSVPSVFSRSCAPVWVQRGTLRPLFCGDLYHVVPHAPAVLHFT